MGKQPVSIGVAGSVVVENFNHSTPVGDMVRWTASLQATDTITKGVFP